MAKSRGGVRRLRNRGGGFLIEPIHYRDYPISNRVWRVPASGIVPLYHSSNADWQGFVEKGILAGGNRDVYAHQAPLPFEAHRYTIEFEANVNNGEMRPRGGGGLNGGYAYENPRSNSYRTDFVWYGVWYSTGSDIPARAIRTIVDNETNKVVYRR